MNLSSELRILGQYLAGEFDNQEQALAEPVWYVSLKLWQRPLHLFAADSITLFVEQANMATIAQPYRQRVIRLGYSSTDAKQLQAQYYMLKNIDAVKGGGSAPDKLKSLTPDDVEFLPSCTLNINVEQLEANSYRFVTTPACDTPCSFNYAGNAYQVFLGFEVTSAELKTYDRGIDPITGKSLWGALMGPFCFKKRQDFADVVSSYT
ncbi:chromophore lyase CpcT/CpeT [Merismopedia glauca]|uniref:Chromophore lyase CpcT/CpeT n=1 Tax=Merismopedia glauca CCAP 1448/3 TaxID=1296344 RepID=A0A2T1C114_9CYAN|nr:chromophore lyase CpcT/CpeT [Merismopedia glauca]PSB01965.1 chorismate mutase [Merismopedia glauca CCAP 1448/3]